MNLFGKRKPATSAPSSGGAPSTKDAIVKMHEAEDQLTKREEHLMRKIDEELAAAKKCAASKNKHGTQECGLLRLSRRRHITPSSPRAARS